MNHGQRPKSPVEEMSENLGRLVRDISSINTSLSSLHVKSDIIAQSFKRLADDRMEDRFNIERYGRRIAAMEHQMALISQKPDVPDWQPDPREITGTHDFNVIKAQFEEMREKIKEEEKHKRDSGIWWKRQRWLWAVALLFVLITSGLGCGSAFVMNRVMQQHSGK